MIKRSESFGTVAKQYQKYRLSYDLKIYKLLAFLLGGKSGYKILDIGCGTGKSTEPLTKIFKKTEIIGCDPDVEMLKEARFSAKKQKLPIEYIEGRAEKLPFENDSFDAVIAGTAFHWFSSPKDLEEIKRVLKKKGLFFIFLNNFFRTSKPIGIDVFKKYEWRIPKEKLEDGYETSFLKKSGFCKVEAKKIISARKNTIEKIVEEMKTYSSYIALSEKNKKSFIKEIKAAYQKEYKNSKYFFDKRELFVYYGFKK